MKRLAVCLLVLFSTLGCSLFSAPARPGKRTPTAGQTATPKMAGTPTAPAVALGDQNILLLGCDAIDDGPSWRTDSIIIVAVRPKPRMVAMFSIPRDLWITIPGYYEQRINVVDYLGETSQGPGRGPALLAATLQENLGIPVNAYVRIHFKGLVRVIDALGGITVDADRALPEYGIVAGKQHMDGSKALNYARDRSRSNDLVRTRRQQQILLAMREAALRPGVLLQLPQLARSLSSAIETNLRPEQALSLIALGLQLRPESIRGRVFDYSMVRDWVTPAGAMVLLPNVERIKQAWADLIAAERNDLGQR